MFLTKEIILERLKEIDERKKAGQSIDRDAEEILLQLKEMGGCKEKKKRGWRDKADPLSLEYEDYRKTKLWKQIKCRIFLRDKSSCQRCGGTADYVHHISYDSIVMLGQDDSKLVALCSGCHEIVHFDSAGVKRNQDEQLAALTDLSLNEVMPKVDLRRTRSSPPSWARLTSVQKMKWNEEFNQRKLEQLAKKILKHKLINKPKVEHD